MLVTVGTRLVSVTMSFPALRLRDSRTLIGRNDYPLLLMVTFLPINFMPQAKVKARHEY